MKDTRILNQALMPYLQQKAIERLESCDVFVEVYKKGFVEKKFKQNVREIYTNDKEGRETGYYRISQKDITICRSGKNGTPLTPSDIENDEMLLGACIHEIVHAILRRDGSKIRNTEYSTGVLEHRIGKPEIGRGINEGLTEWIREKTGLPSSGYSVLTSIIHQLEIARGAKAIMEMGKGNPRKSLRMTKEECNKFLALGDLELVLDRNYQIFQRVRKKLEADGEGKQEFLESIKQDSRMRGFFEHARSDGQEVDIGTALEFVKQQEESYQNKRDKNRLRIDSAIFDKYFEKEFEQIEKSDVISGSQLKKFIALRSFMCNGAEIENAQEYSSIRFQKRLEELKNRYVSNILQGVQKVQEDLQKGRLSANQLTQYYRDISEINKDLGRKLLDRISQTLNPQYASTLSELLLKLCDNNNLGDINRYSIQLIKTKKGEKTLYIKDGMPYSEEGKSFRTIKGKIGEENAEQYMSFTDELDDDFQAIVKDFSRLTSEIKGLDPQAKIQILGRVIIADSMNKRQIYVIEDKGIVPAKEVNTVEIPSVQTEKQENLPTVEPKGKIGIIMRKLRKFFTRQTNRQEETIDERPKKSNLFKARISDMSQYSTNTYDTQITEYQSDKVAGYDDTRDR